MIDKSLSKFHFDEVEASKEFAPDEMNKLRYMHRRLQYIEAKARDSADITTGGGVHTLFEIECLSWLLDEVGFLLPREPPVAVSGNRRAG